MDDKHNSAGPAVGMEAFFTRPRANEGIQLPLYLPTGQKSEHWLRIRGVDSDVFRLAEAEARRDAVRIAAMDEADRGKEMEDSKRRLIAALVMDWSFDKPCDQAAVEEFFLQAPHIMQAVDNAASKRALFFGLASSS